MAEEPLALPTDEQFLDELYKELGDDEWIEIQNSAGKHEEPAVTAQKAIDAGEFGQDQFEELTGAIRESLAPSLYFRGAFIRQLKRAALQMLAPYSQQLENVPVGCVPTRLLNAGAYRTPRGGAVILLDSGVILQLGLLVRTFFSYYTWNAPDRFAAGKPHCHDHSQASFGRTIQHLAAFSVTGEVQQLRAITTWNCPSLRTYDQSVEFAAMGIELFIMLHEFGHVALGHLDGCSTMSVPTRLAGELTVYTNSQKQEFEADKFAFEHYCSSGMRRTDIAFSCGLLFHLFHLAELIRPPKARTHPPALARWEKIKELTPLSAYPESWSNFLDEAFMPLSDNLPLA